MIRVLLEMLDFLFAVEHLPATNAKRFAIRLSLDELELLNEVLPLCGRNLEHDIAAESLYFVSFNLAILLTHCLNNTCLRTTMLDTILIEFSRW